MKPYYIDENSNKKYLDDESCSYIITDLGNGKDCKVEVISLEDNQVIGTYSLHSEEYHETNS